jgi:membrane fusion protein, heavy metal efflux system
MNRSLIVFAALVAPLLVVAWIAAGPGRSAPPPPTAHAAHGDAHGVHEKEEKEGHIELADDRLALAGVGLAQAGPARLLRTLPLTGIVTPNEEAMSQIVPRFPGVVRQIRKRLGDGAERGETLAVIESNQSLTGYALKSPVAGTVIERRVSPGEAVNDQRPLFVVADLSTVWVDLAVHRSDFGKLAVGQAVRIETGRDTPPVDARITYLSPFGTQDTQTMLARAVVANADRALRPGLFVDAAVLLAEHPAAVAVDATALQTLGDRTVVFVREGDGFAARSVELGARDADRVEILSGLDAGETYAASNSFVLKAELGKGAAAHEH